MILQVRARDDMGTNEVERMPAAEMIHGFIQRRARQGRGVPWMAASLRRLKMLAGYEEAELVASRVGASKMGFFIEPEEGQMTGDDEEGRQARPEVSSESRSDRCRCRPDPGRTYCGSGKKS